MDIKQEDVNNFQALKFSAVEDGQTIGRVWLYLLRNDLHDRPFAFIEDLFVEEPYRKKGCGRELIDAAVRSAREKGCYKILGTSRNENSGVHQFYLRLGFKKYGFEFRMDLE